MDDSRTCCSSERKIIEIVLKRTHGISYGLTLNFQSNNRCYISHVSRNSSSYYCTKLRIGDEIIKINNISIDEINMKNLHTLLNESQELRLHKISREVVAEENCNFFIRTMLEYDPKKLNEPQSELYGLKFDAGDILNVFSTENKNWWCARKLTENNEIEYGIIPSHKFQMNTILKFMSTLTDGQGLTPKPPPLQSISDPLHRQFSSIISRFGSKILKSSKTSQSKYQSSKSDPLNTFSSKSPNSSLFLQNMLNSDVSSSRINSNIPTPPFTSTSLTSSRMSHQNSSILGHVMKGFEVKLDDFIFDDASSTCYSTFSEFINDLQKPPAEEDSDKLKETQSSWIQYAPLYYSQVEFIPYEEVVPVDKFKRKCVLLLGVHGVGKREVKHNLLVNHPDMFISPVSYTTRQRNEYEVDGRDYYFISTEQMKEKIKNNELLDYSSYKSEMYGVSKSSVRRLMHQSKIILLDVSTDCINMLRNREFCPYLVFIACDPNLPNVGTLYKNGEFNVALEMMVRESELMQFVFRPYIDLIIVQKSVDKTVRTIASFVERMEDGLQWIPVSWTC